jgi:hypothetical protein
VDDDFVVEIGTQACVFCGTTAIILAKTKNEFVATVDIFILQYYYYSL